MLAVRHSLGLAWAMLPILVQHPPRDRDRMGLRPGQMAGRLGLTLAEYRSLEAGELDISNDLDPPLLVPRSHLAASTDNEDLGCLDRSRPPSRPPQPSSAP